MARKRTILVSDRVSVQRYAQPQKAWEEAMRGLLNRLCKVVQEEFDLPLTIEMVERREDLEIWIEARLAGRDIGRGRNWGKYDKG